MLKRLTVPLIAALAVIFIANMSATVYAQEKVHKIVMHVDDNDPKRMNMVLNNASNVDKYFKAKGEEVQIEIVAYGPGLTMLMAEKSPVKKRVLSFGQNFDNISFSACGNTHRKMSKKAGKQIALLSNAKMVTSGVVQLVMRQEQGWSYVRP
ncbi:MAG: hypothetical protein QGH73_06950 [Rhodospirillales bacterium]|jgi:hypothetical protein|nr:hypothetical protein [Rhodospirillales bacterium]MDP6644821.1 hypothetical protein [Rhodospirillales bacterium]MDP6841400.1 hypothetical protein [Rhodospirillales bacterium]|tara:strand:- start:390 stop:845 length:456 start_codon:yes stop_codon:yes gene_type:complete